MRDPCGTPHRMHFVSDVIFQKNQQAVKSLFVSVCENITILLFDLLQMTYFYHKITKTSEALLSRMNESLSRMNACLCDFVMVFRQWAGSVAKTD